MNPIEYLRALRRRWLDIVLAVTVALIAGYFISSAAPAGPASKSYEATSVLLSSGNIYAIGAPSLDALAELTTVGQVPIRVAKRIGYEGSPADLALQVKTSTNTEAGILRITSSSSDAAEAELLATAFAEELVGYLHDLQASSITQEASALQAELDTLEDELRDLEQSIVRASPIDRRLLVAQRDAKIRQYGLVYESYQQLAASRSNPVNLDLIQTGLAREVASGGIEPPKSLLSRLILAGLLGLISGIILVFVLDRFDSRIRDRKTAEQHFGAPVLAEIPFIPRWKRRPDRIESLEEPRSGTADAYRIVAAMLSMPSAKSGNGDGDGTWRNGSSSPLRRVLITSPGPSDGKTTVAANLAAVLGARGTKTTVFSCDLRRPRIHRLFGVPNLHGLSDTLSLDGRVHTDVPSQSSPVAPNVRVVPSGPPPEEPGELLGSLHMREILAQAQLEADVLVIDTAPILTTSDAAHLVTQVDAVVIVARAGRTTADVAQRTSELMKRLGAPVKGVILNATSELSVPRRYYSYRYYRRAGKPRRGFHRLARHSAKG